MSDFIEKLVDLAAPIDRVWQAIADPAQFGAWFGVAIETPLVAGAPAHGFITAKGYEHVRWAVEVVAIEPPHRFAFTWHPYAIDPAIDYSGETPTLVEFLLAETADGTRLTLRESGFDAVPAHRRAEAMRMNDRGWAVQAENVRAHVTR